MLRKANKPIDIVIIPGSRHTNDEYWYPQLARKLADQGLEVLYPKFPPIQEQNLTNWNNVLAPYEDQFTDRTIFVGHSLGGRFLFNYLQNHRAGAAFFVSAPFKLELERWKQYMSSDSEARELLEKYWETTNGTFFKEEINWTRILYNVGKIHLFYSEKDNLIPVMHPIKIQRRIGGEIYWVPNGRHLDVDLEKIPELTQTVLRVYEEIKTSHPEGQRIKIEG